MLFNTVTTVAIAIGVATLYIALLAFSMVGAFSLIPPHAFRDQIGRAAVTTDYLHLRGWAHRSPRSPARWAR